MRRRSQRAGKKAARPKAKLGLPDLDQAKAAVLSTLRSPESQRGYRHAIDEFIWWYCSEPRLSFNKTVVTRYRIHLESRQLAPGTINVRLAGVRRLAYEAADSGLLSPELAAGIRRVRGARKLGVRLGNWLTTDQAHALWRLPGSDTLKGKRDRALLAVLLGCGLRRRELAELTLDHLQRREDHWAIVDLVGKGGHIRTVPVPDWVKQTLDDWVSAAGIENGRVFRCVCRAGKAWGDGMTEKVVWHVVKHSAAKLGLERLAPARPSPLLCPVVSPSGRGAGADSIPARPCLGADDGEVPWVQAAPSWSRERPDRHRAMSSGVRIRHVATCPVSRLYVQVTADSPRRSRKALGYFPSRRPFGSWQPDRKEPGGSDEMYPAFLARGEIIRD